MKDLAQPSPLELLHNPWAVREDAIPAIRAYLRGGGANESQVNPEPEEQAAMRGAPVDLYGSVAIISIRGLIMPGASLLSVLLGGTGLSRVRSQLRNAMGNDEVNSILLDVNSPGGYLDLVPETAAEIREAAEEKNVVAVANTSAASAAYWLAAQASQVVVTPSGQVGSVGVFTMHEDWSKYDEQLGVKTTLISAGKYKTEGNPYEPLSEEAETAMQERVNETHKLFLSELAKGRGGITAKKIESDFGEGRMVRAKDAVSRGMADKVATFEETLARMARGKSAGTGRKGMQLREHIESVTTDVDEVTSRVADAVAQRAENGQQLAEATQDRVAELESSIERLREAFAIEPRNDQIAAEVQREFLRYSAGMNKQGDRQ